MEFNEQKNNEIVMITVKGKVIASRKRDVKRYFEYNKPKPRRNYLKDILDLLQFIQCTEQIYIEGTDCDDCKMMRSCRGDY